MSHQTGIQCTDQLLAFISQCKNQSNNGAVRVLKVLIRNEELVLDQHFPPEDDWKQDYRRYVDGLVHKGEPAYILFRLDSKDTIGTYEWLFISWTPEDSSVRQKMVYASTKATFKQQFGGGNITQDYHATALDEISFDSFEKWLNGKTDGLPLSRKEQELLEVRRDEALSSCITKTQKMTLSGLEFPIDSEAINALFDLKDDNLSYVQLSIDMKSEEIRLNIKKTSSEFNIHSIESLMPTDGARYHLFVFPHTFDGQFNKSIIFVYSIPTSFISVKERMLYSSCKNALLNAITNRIGIHIDKKLETDNPRELSHSYLIDELHPKQDIVKTMFDKPKGPAGKRGARRLINNSNGED
ncbi:twinfilin-1-like [Oppia nitens]|uniref:twinfilin-1-like n=1 Tax=Oppia nitens TaxID=1686743 RepID=UPI0023D9F038|nr:twinfilin-1-like [Oppia nitens]